MKKLLFLSILMLLPMLASADPVEIGGICYNLVEETKEAEVSPGPNNYNIVDLTIPESVEYEGVTYNVTSIGSEAFYYCTGLKSVTISKYVATIGNQAFDGCKNLSSVTIANGVTSIGVAAFQLCTSLTSLTIPNSVTAIAEGAFQGCSGLQSIVVDKGNTVYDSREDCNALIKTSDNKLITGCMNTTIPNSITAIGSWAFFLCDGLTSINIPNSVTGIEQSAFWGCKNLVSINIPNSVTEIEEQTFALCEALTSVTIPNSVTTIGDQAFSGCIGLTSVTIGSKVKTIGSLAFTDCLNLLDVYCYAEKVPETQNEVFRSANIENVTLHVPATSVSAYQAVEPWKNFKEIVALSENDTDDSDYLPFVEMGKQWNVVIPYGEPYYGGSISGFQMIEEVERDGKAYAHTQRNLYAECEVQEAGLFREENRRVYKYDETTGRDIMMYDFSLKEGDTFTYEFGYDQPVNCKVLKEGWLEDGPDIISSSTSNPDGTLDIKYRKLRTWTIGRENESGEYEEIATWVECIGALENVFGLIDNGLIKFENSLAYVRRKGVEVGDGKNDYLPFSFYSISMHGCNLPTGESNEEYDDELHHLTYEMEGDRLHIYGDVYTQCGPNNYAYFYEMPPEYYNMPTDDPSVRIIELLLWEVAPVADCMAHHHTDFYVTGFDPNLNYYVSDNNGEIHPVIKKMAYHPFIEDDKVWAVRLADEEQTEEYFEYYYFDGDTIINGQTAKRMLYDRIGSNWDKSGEYIGAWYEQDKKVYYAGKGKQQFELLYDFTLSTGDIIQNHDRVLQVTKMSGSIPGFKGTYLDLQYINTAPIVERWLEGVGSQYYPWLNLCARWAGVGVGLLFCKAGDEIIYYNSEDEDPFSMGAKKHRFDFSHTIKTKPKARTREDDAVSLYGEYNNLLLGINLNPLDATYLVRITNESDQVVYEKTINAGSIVGLNIDISAFAKGRYTVTMENSSEVFTGEFETLTTGIQELKSSRIEELKSIYNLQGQRLNRLQKGLNIVGGRKVFVK